MSGRWRLAGRLALAASGWVTFALMLLPPDPVRAVLAFGYVLFCPGLALVTWAEQVNGLRSGHGFAMDPLRRLTIALAAGTACGALVCEAYYLADAYTVPRAAITLACVTSVGALWPLVMTRLPAAWRGAGDTAIAGAPAGQAPRVDAPSAGRPLASDQASTDTTRRT